MNLLLAISRCSLYARQYAIHRWFGLFSLQRPEILVMKRLQHRKIASRNLNDRAVVHLGADGFLLEQHLRRSVYQCWFQQASDQTVDESEDWSLPMKIIYLWVCTSYMYQHCRLCTSNDVPPTSPGTCWCSNPVHGDGEGKSLILRLNRTARSSKTPMYQGIWSATGTSFSVPV